jgi:hypothetical protein
MELVTSALLKSEGMTQSLMQLFPVVEPTITDPRLYSPFIFQNARHDCLLMFF